MPAGGLSRLLVEVLAEDRLDTWVLRVGIAVPLLCLAGLVLWHLFARLTARPRPVRQSPEPPAPDRPRRLEALAGDEPERLQQECNALEDTLAQRYLELGESWLLRGEADQAVAAFARVVQLCPDRPRALLAGDRLKQLGRG